jgi:hypothetical protein
VDTVQLEARHKITKLRRLYLGRPKEVPDSMKSTIDQLAVAGIACAALAAHEQDYNVCDGRLLAPEDLAGRALNLNGVCSAYPQVDGTCDGMVTAFDAAFLFGLQVGARIGADPLHLPNVKDLADKYRFKSSERDAA